MPNPRKLGLNRKKLPSSSVLAQEPLLLPEIDNVTNWLQSTNISVAEALDRDRENEKKKEEVVCWFHENTTRNLAECKLKEAGNSTGLFLVRDSVGNVGDFVLSLINQGQAEHYQIRQTGHGQFGISNDHLCRGLDGFIASYQLMPHELPTQLLTPCRGEPPPPLSRATGYTNLLHRAIREGNTELALLILSHKNCPDVNAKDSEGSTALHQACISGYEKVAKKLLDKSASVVMTDSGGYTPLQQACIHNQAPVIRHLIIQGRADPQDRHHDTGRVALHEAAKRGFTECVRSLLNLNAPAWPRDVQGVAPYEMAYSGGHKATASHIASHRPFPACASQTDWYHNKVDRQGAIAILQKHGLKDGMFLVRKSSRHKGSFVLAMTYDMHPYNYEIQCMDGNIFYLDDGPLLPSLEHLIDYYSTRPDGLPLRLTLAVSPDDTVKSMVIRWLPDDPCPGRLLAPPRINTIQRSPASRRKKTYVYALQPPPPPPREPLSLDPDSIDFGYELGQGEYGSVLKGVWTSPEGKRVNVAIKTLHSQYMEAGREIFMREAKVMVKLDHSCIIKLIGVCMGPPIMLVQELMPLGSLLDYLLDHPEKVNVETDLYLWASQIACGMCYLEEQRFVHRDLAARNILLASKNQARVGDFGLSRAVEGSSNYYRASEGGRWPVKWYAPECVNYGTFSSASDVWSYGITLWEMFSFGGQPYGSMIGVQVIAHIERGGRLEKPGGCPSSVYHIMQRCWEYEAGKRPTFKELYGHFRKDPEYAVPDKVMSSMGFSVSSTSV